MSSEAVNELATVASGRPALIEEINSIDGIREFPSKSVRVIGRLIHFDVGLNQATIEEGGVSLLVDVEYLTPFAARLHSLFMFIGELTVVQDEREQNVILKARVGFESDGLDMNLYREVIMLRRQHEAQFMDHRRGAEQC